MLKLASIAVVLMNSVCDIPGVIDVSEAERFGDQVLLITIPTAAEHEAVEAALPEEVRQRSLHIMPLFGLGSFTGDSPETKEALSLVYQHPYNVYGTPEQQKLDVMLKDIEARELEVWASMNEEERREAIAAEVKRQRAAGRTGFGNCWSD